MPHLDRSYEQELTDITSALGRMCDQAERMVRDAVLAVLSRDERLAREVVDADQVLDAEESDLDARCVKLLARRAPVGGDLRMITATLKLVTDLERIGDLAVNVVKRGLPGDPAIGLPDEVADLARAVVDEVATAMTSLRTRDAALARTLRSEDRATDDRNKAAFDRLIRLGHDRPEAFEPLLSLINVCRHLERIGDHAVNVGEMVVFLVEGKVLRHAPDA